MRLPDPSRSRAILIGVGTYQSAGLPDVLAIRNNLDGLAAALTNPDTGGFSAENCTVLIDPSSVRFTFRAIRDYADRTEDTLLVYFAGHGLVGARLGELYLGLADTEPSELLVSALNFNLIREVFLDCPAKNRVLILDCCFSGRAIQDFLAAPQDAVLGELEIAGTYTLASAPPNTLALSPPGAPYTAFTGELLTLLTNGIPDGDELITLGTTYRHLRRTMVAKGLPAPGQRGTDTADLLALTRNPAYALPVEVETPTEPAPSPTPDPLRRSVPGGVVWVVAVSIVVSIIIAVTVPLIVIGIQHNNAASGLPPSSEVRQTTTTISTTSTSLTGLSQPPSSFDLHNVVVRVYNSSAIPHLGAKASSEFQADGWIVIGISIYAGGNIGTSTVYFQPGTYEEAAARELARKFNMRVEERFPDISGVGPGVIVIVTKDYGSK